MFYPLIRIWARLALKIFLRNVVISNPRSLETEGPVLITANHPNSFLDAIIIGALYKHPIHFLARGDAFNKPWHAKLLGLLQMIPVYRLSEGKENLVLNDQAFRKSKEVLSTGGVLLIFIEGICLHKHELQPFKKGAARIATDCKDIPGMKVMPMGLAYDSFTHFGKNISLDFGDPIAVNSLLPYEEETKNMRHMNDVLYNDIAHRINVPQHNKKRNTNILLWLPGLVGLLLHWPMYNFLSKSIAKKTEGTVFYDSVLFGALLLLYPVYLLLLAVILFLLNTPFLISVLILLIHPLTARAAVQQRRG